MARPVPIGDYEPRVPVEEGLRRIIPEARPSGTGQAIEEFGAAAQHLAQSEASQYTTQQLAQAQSNWSQQLMERQQSAAPGAPNFTPTLMQDYGNYVKDAVKGAPNSIASRMLSQRLTEFGQRLAQESLRFETGAKQTHNEITSRQSIDSGAVLLQGDPTQYGALLKQNQDGIDGMSMEPQVKEKLADYARSTLSGAAVMGDINRDPYQAMLAINSPDAKGYYADLTAEQRDHLMAHADTMLHQRVADAERVHQMAKQEQQDASDTLLKQGIVMSQSGQLTPGWVVSHSRTLEPAAMKYLLDEASGRKVESDVHTYADLLNRVGRGEDVREDATNALYAGHLSKEDFTRITDKASSEVPNAYKRGLQYIQTAGKTSELEPDPAKTQTLANMQNDFQDWAKANPKATDRQTQDEAIDIVKRYQLVPADKNLLTLPVPRFMQGTRAAPDIQATKKATTQAFQQGLMSKEEFDKQALLIQQWEHVLTITKAKAPKAKAND